MLRIAVCTVATVALTACTHVTGGREAPNTYFGLDEGLMVTHEHTQTADGAESRAIFEITNLPARELNGITVVPRQTDGGGQSSLLFVAQDAEGIYTAAYQLAADAEPRVVETRNYILKLPLAVGTSWSSEHPGSKRRWGFPVELSTKIVAAGQSVTVPGGTFGDCLKIESKGEGTGTDEQGIHRTVSVAETAWYCRGVGGVKFETREVQTVHDAAGNSTSTHTMVSQLMAVERDGKPVAAASRR